MKRAGELPPPRATDSRVLSVISLPPVSSSLGDGTRLSIPLAPLASTKLQEKATGQNGPVSTPRSDSQREASPWPRLEPAQRAAGPLGVILNFL